jgi:hypothetical protein
MRIYKKKYYILSHIPGISGFKRWDEREYSVCMGHHAQYNRTKVVKEFIVNGKGNFRLCDRHLPDYCPTANETEALKWLDENYYSEIFLLNPEVYLNPKFWRMDNKF